MKNIFIASICIILFATACGKKECCAPPPPDRELFFRIYDGANLLKNEQLDSIVIYYKDVHTYKHNIDLTIWDKDNAGDFAMDGLMRSHSLLAEDRTYYVQHGTQEKLDTIQVIATRHEENQEGKIYTIQSIKYNGKEGVADSTRYSFYNTYPVYTFTR